MDTLRNKRYENYNYISRYTAVPYYYDTLNERQVYGIGANVIKNSSFITHKIVQTDTLYSLALKYYNNPSYWWIIAYFNNIQDAFTPLFEMFEVIQIPSISSIEFGDLR